MNYKLNFLWLKSIFAILVLSTILFTSCKEKPGQKKAAITKENAPDKEPVNINKLLNDLDFSLPRQELKAANFSFEDLKGKKVSLKDYQGKVIFLTFWASWCPPCTGGLLDIQALHETMKGRDFVILAVSFGESQKTIRDFLKTNPYTYTILLDPKKEVLKESYDITKLPTSFVINKAGMIIGMAEGPRNWSEPPFIQLFNQLSQE